VIRSLIGKIGKANSVDELKVAFNSFSEQEKILFTKVFSNQKQDLVKNTSKFFYDRVRVAVKNGSINLAKIPMKQRQQWKEFLSQLGATAGISATVVAYQVNQMMGEAEQLVDAVSNLENRLENEDEAMAEREAFLKAWKEQNQQQQ
jgi:hypothetical protein